MHPRSRKVTVDVERLEQIIEAAGRRPLDDDEQDVLKALLETTLWIESELKKGQLDFKRLYRMLFGPHSEKTKDVFPNADDEERSEDESPPEHQDDEPDDAEGQAHATEEGGGDDLQEDDEGDAHATDHGAGGDEDRGDDDGHKGHGRRAASDYHGAEKICVDHDSLKPGQRCPRCGKGKVYAYQPRLQVRIRGGAPLSGTVHELEQLRCNLCGDIFTARPPPEARGPKYDDTAAAMIALLRYGAGFPHNRLGKLQESLGVPLPPSTQWDVVSQAASALFPLYEEYLRQAASGHLVHNDDTKMPVLALTGRRRDEEAPADDPDERTGMFTTGIISHVDEQRIALFITGRQHAGENLNDLLRRRAAELDAPLQMCDGLDRNLPGELVTIVGNCLGHARRHFVDVADNFPGECRYILETLGEVFRNDKHCRESAMPADERLAFHKQYSLPVMNELQAWCRAQLDERRVEPNSGLGRAIGYMLKRWDKLTLFCHKAGAPIDNNICERALKRAIVHRKNSYFYRSLRGARIGDMYMSLIHTAELCGADPLDYMVTLLRNASLVEAAPAAWMPWCYVDTRARLAEQAA